MRLRMKLVKIKSKTYTRYKGLGDPYILREDLIWIGIITKAVDH